MRALLLILITTPAWAGNPGAVTVARPFSCHFVSPDPRKDEWLLLDGATSESSKLKLEPGRAVAIDRKLLDPGGERAWCASVSLDPRDPLALRARIFHFEATAGISFYDSQCIPRSEGDLQTARSERPIRPGSWFAATVLGMKRERTWLAVVYPATPMQHEPAWRPICDAIGKQIAPVSGSLLLTGAIPQ